MQAQKVSTNHQTMIFFIEKFLIFKIIGPTNYRKINSCRPPLNKPLNTVFGKTFQKDSHPHSGVVLSSRNLSVEL